MQKEPGEGNQRAFVLVRPQYADTSQIASENRGMGILAQAVAGSLNVACFGRFSLDLPGSIVY